MEEAVLELQRTAGNQAAGAALGSGLPFDLRTELEERVGADLADVRVHADADADRRARAERAAAFTQGKDVYFRDGLYRPETSAGRVVIAHEIAHVVQQSVGSRRTLASPAALEVEADAVAHSHAAGPVVGRAAAGAVQRLEGPGEPPEWWVRKRRKQGLPVERAPGAVVPPDVKREAAERKVAEIRERLAQVTPEQREEDERLLDDIRARQAEREGRPYERKFKEPSTFEEIAAEGRRQAAEMEAKRAAQRAQQVRSAGEATELSEGRAREGTGGGQVVESHGEFTDDQGRPVYGDVTLHPLEGHLEITPQAAPRAGPPKATPSQGVLADDWAKRWNQMTPEERAREMWKARTPTSEHEAPAPKLPEFYSEYQRKLDEPPAYINWLPYARYGWLGGELASGESVSGRDIDRWEKAKQIAIEAAIDIATGEAVGRLGGAIKGELKGVREILRESPGFTPPKLGPKLPPAFKPPPIAEQAAEEEAKQVLGSGEKQAAREVAREVPPQLGGEQHAAKETRAAIRGEEQAARELTGEAPRATGKEATKELGQEVREAEKAAANQLETQTAPPKKPPKAVGKKGGGGKLPKERLTRAEERGREILRSFAEGQEKAGRGPLDVDVLEQPGMKGKPLPRRAKVPGTPPEQFEVGNFSHEHAEELVPRSKLPRGLDSEVVIDRGPELPPLRADRVDWKKRVIYEIKPDNPSWRAAGEDQLKIYKGYLDKQFPGKPFRTKLVTYDYKAALKTLKKWGYLP
jgi:hypothetical protein